VNVYDNKKIIFPGRIRYVFLSGILGLILLSFLSCSEKPAQHKELSLSDDYDKIKKIISIADCKSPSDEYVTEVHSSTDGNCYFYQKSNSGRPPFIAKIDTEYNGYMIDSTGNILDTLTKEMKSMLNGHELHMMQVHPSLYFTEISFVEKGIVMNKECEVFQGRDKLDNLTKLYFNRDMGVISKIELLNPVDTSETIQIINKVWKDSDYGKLVQEADIIQAEKDTFSFVFKTIEINP